MGNGWAAHPRTPLGVNGGGEPRVRGGRRPALAVCAHERGRGIAGRGGVPFVRLPAFPDWAQRWGGEPGTCGGQGGTHREAQRRGHAGRGGGG